MAQLKTDRIAFVNIRNGNIMFDCHPAEARIAAKFIKKVRENKGVEKLLYAKENIEIQRTAIFDKTPKVIIENENSLITVRVFSKMFAEIEIQNYTVSAIFMNAYRYSDIREWGKDVYNEYEFEQLNIDNIKGDLWGAYIVIDNHLSNEEVIFTSVCQKTKKLKTPYVVKVRLNTNKEIEV